MLAVELIPAVRSKRIGILASGIVLHRGSARPHTASSDVETIRKLKLELLRQFTTQCRSFPAWLPYFCTDQRCVTWTPICKPWRGRGRGSCVASRATENSLRR